MEGDINNTGPVDPEVRAYVYSLVSALGGTGADEDGRYVLGDDALACLKDIKRWLKLHDEELNRFDVARSLAEANLVNGDLLEILAAWPEEATEDRLKSKIALACLELLVPLTWPIEKNELQTTVNHHRHIPYLQLAQISYKREILEHPSSSILRSSIRIGLPSIALPMGERGSRDEGIIKLLLNFLRNIVVISAPHNLSVEWNENEVSRSATIEAFHSQDVLTLLLTLASNMGEDFNTQDVVILELLFHLVKGVEIEKLFMDDVRLEAKKSNDLRNLMEKEKEMLRGYAKNAPTRHNRFGTMIWVKRDDERHSAVSGQELIFNNQGTLKKMDESKKWNRPKQRGKHEHTLNHFDLPIPLTASANRHLRSFVEDFLDSGFNPLFNHVRRAIEREAERVLEAHSHQFFYLVSWFLQAERVRRKSNKTSKSAQSMKEMSEPNSYGFVATVLNQEIFILLNRFMQDRLDLKLWNEVNSGMRCLSQILLTVQEMTESNIEEDQEIADNIQNRIFYEETTHDRIISILRSYKDQGFSYLDASTELSHIFLRMLERYSKENIDLQIRSRRRARRREKAVAPVEGTGDQVADQDSEAEDATEAQRVSKERTFDFRRFSAKFLTQGCIDTFVVFVSFFKELNAEQLKRAHRFFYRVAFKQEMSVVLFRLDIVSLFNKIINGPEALSQVNPMFKEWEELARQVFRRMIKKLQQRPELYIELLFSKINSTAHYLEYGYEKQTATSKPRAPAELEIKGALTRDEQIGIAVAVLYGDELDAVDFVKGALLSAITERRSWEDEAVARQILRENNSGSSIADQSSDSSKAPPIVVKPGSDARRIAMFKNNKLRLLMKVAGLERLGLEDGPDAIWIIPSALTSDQLQETSDTIERHRNDPIMYYGEEDPVPAEEMLRRASVAKPQRAEYDDDSEDDPTNFNGEEEFLFPAGGPTSRKSALTELKKSRRKRRVVESGDEGGIDDETREARRKARLLADQEKRRKIKSEEFVYDSDDESNEERDREFFAGEERMRANQAKGILEALKATPRQANTTTKSKKRNLPVTDIGKSKRARHGSSDSESEDNDLLMMSGNSSSSGLDRILDVSDEEAPDTPLSSPHDDPFRRVLFEEPKRPQESPGHEEQKQLVDSEEGDDDPLEMRTARDYGRQRRITLFDDSDDD